MLEFILERYNYWIFIVLMMTGLYIVISRGNLVKKIIGLNVFQTSVFIFYISIGKIAGGTAPILVGGEDGHHGDDANAIHPEAHGSDDINETLHANHGANPLDVMAKASESSHASSAAAIDHGSEAADMHLAVDTSSADETIKMVAAPVEVDSHGTDASHAVAEIIYTNPLPHVLILTAIVVGVATTAVGLALAVRIREAYGSIEEDELEADDYLAEFGVSMHAKTESAA